MKYAILLSLICILSTLSAHTYVDSVYADPELDGDMAYMPNGNPHSMNDWTYAMIVGDTYETFAIPANSTSRAFFSFNLPEIPEGYKIKDINLRLYQLNSYGNLNFANALPFPEWNVENGDTVSCIISHIDYGEALGYDDWEKGNIGNEYTFTHNVGTITAEGMSEPNNHGEVGFRYIDITECVLQDYETGRTRSQYRIAFEIDTDYDDRADYVTFETSDHVLDERKPTFLITYWDGVSIDDETETEPELSSITIFPQPVHETATIQYQVSKPQTVEISIYNVRGRKVEEICRNVSNIGTQQQTIQFQNHPSGIYFVRISTDSRKTVKRILHFK